MAKTYGMASAVMGTYISMSLMTNPEVSPVEKEALILPALGCIAIGAKIIQSYFNDEPGNGGSPDPTPEIPPTPPSGQEVEYDVVRHVEEWGFHASQSSQRDLVDA